MEPIRLESKERAEILEALKYRATRLTDMRDYECAVFLLQNSAEFPAGWTFDKIQTLIIKLAAEIRCGRAASALSMIEKSGLLPPQEKP